MSHTPAKIVLKSTTTKTLNDRFTEMAKKQVRSPPQVTITGVRSNQFQMSQASIKNRRLAAQMANRPGVQAALGGNTLSLKSRLGSPTRGRGRGGNAKGLLKNRLGSSPTVVGGTRGGGRGGSFSGGFRRARGLGSIMRGGVSGKRGIGGGGRGGVSRGGRGIQGAGQGARGGRGATRGRGRGRGQGDKPVSRDKLDEELDKYMSKTKSHLDAELDEYMKHAEEDNE